jgi:starch synthase (maltosyl-transferring)
VPGKEEYLDSEKYQLKPRNWAAPGNIVAEISRLNFLRRELPALQTHLNTRFYNAFNDRVIYYGKAIAGVAEKILILVSLDPFAPQAVKFELPLWEFGLGDEGEVEVEDLMRGTRFRWRGKVQNWYLAPADQPFALLRVRPVDA